MGGIGVTMIVSWKPVTGNSGSAFGMWRADDDSNIGVQKRSFAGSTEAAIDSFFYGQNCCVSSKV